RPRSVHLPAETSRREMARRQRSAYRSPHTDSVWLAPFLMQGHVQHVLQYLFGIEPGLCDPPRRPAMQLVFGVNRRKRRGRFACSGKPKHAFAVRQIRAWPGILYDDRLAARQVADRPIADPGVLGSHVKRLGATELAARR